MRRIDLTGKQFNDWHVLEYLGNKKYLCKCSCGAIKEVSTYKLTSGESKSCGHASNTFIDLSGKHFGDWEVLKYQGNHKWLCRCSCGKQGLITSKALRDGKSTSCGHSTTGFKDLTDQTFNDWTAKEYLGKTIWLCQCSCGKFGQVKASDLISGRSKSCGHNTTALIDLTNKTFGDLKVVEYAENQNWVCQCSCGNIITVSGQKLRDGHTKSCGCKSNEYAKQSSINKYGVPHPSQQHLTPEQIEIASSKEKLQQAINEKWPNNYNNTSNTNNTDSTITNRPTPLMLSEITGLTPHRVMVKIREFGLDDMVDLKKPVSSYEDELNELFPCKHRSDRTVLNGQELDLYYPEQNIAIEFNGSYWHSSEKKDKYYHQKKTILAGKRGIHLIHIFEYEWLDTIQKEKIINLIKFHLDKSNIVTIGARKCTIQPINPTESQEFLDKYHLQNSTPASIHIGCYYDSELIGVMTFGNPRFDRTYEYELIRLCWKPNIVVIGGKEKIFKYFINMYNPKSIVSYCNISKFNGNSYLKLGFTFDSISYPNYVWVNPQTNDILTRYQTMKHKLIEKGIGYINETETEIMERLGYYKIYDCGNMKFTWRNT